MTMKRTTKARHLEQVDMAINSRLGLTHAEFGSPREIAKRHGRRRMTAAEYVIFKMHRGRRDAGQARESWTMARCTRRLRRTRTA